jgi:tight adherence protein B
MLSYDFDPVYLIYGLVAVSVVLVVEAVYLLFFSAASYRSKVNRRLRIMTNTVDREAVLIQLRRERGLTSDGDYSSPVVALNRLVMQSGLTMGMNRLALFIGFGMLVTFAAIMLVHDNVGEALLVTLACGLGMPLLILRTLRSRRHKAFGAQFPDALDMIVRSLRAGHPVPIALATVSREMKDPIGSEFGIVSDEITYGADLETAMRNLYFRVGQDDLPLFVTAVAIQGSTGGNLGEILENLSSVIRQRFKMRRKIRALAAEGRASALILSSLPIGIFLAIQFVSPDFYKSVWHQDLTKIGLGAAAGWMLLGNMIMWRMVNFRI